MALFLFRELGDKVQKDRVAAKMIDVTDRHVSARGLVSALVIGQAQLLFARGERATVRKEQPRDGGHVPKGL